jgi:hypothetical protein
MSGGDDWAPGDLALLVTDGLVACPHSGDVYHTGEGCPPHGSVREVTHVGPDIYDGEACGCLRLTFADGIFGADWRFVRIPPLTEPETAAFTADLRDCLRTPAKHTA